MEWKVDGWDVKGVGYIFCPQICPMAAFLWCSHRPSPYQGNSESVSGSVGSDSLRPHGLQPARLLWPWNSPGKSIGVGCHSLFQRIFPTQGSNLGLLHCRQILYRLNHQGNIPSWLYEYWEFPHSNHSAIQGNTYTLPVLSPFLRWQAVLLIYKLSTINPPYSWIPDCAHSPIHWNLLWS